VLAWGEPGFGPGQFGWYPPPSAATGPWGIAVAPDGTIYVSDPGGNRVQQFTSQGVFLSTFDGQGSGADLEEPYGLAFDSFGNCFVTDAWTYLVVKFAPGGSYVTSWGEYGCCSGLWRSAYDLDVDSQGNVWVTDAGNGQIQVFDNAGGFLTRWGVEGSEAGQFYGPESIAFDGAGTVYVADTGNNRVEKYVGAVSVTPMTWGGIKAIYR
jgi:DNA-binding beta-propeller fold protein YncE